MPRNLPKNRDFLLRIAPPAPWWEGVFPRHFFFRSATLGLLALLLGGWGEGSLRAADSLKWDAKADRVDASVESWTVPLLLEHVAAATGWQILVDPDIRDSVSAKFKQRTPGEALQRLLAGLNFALVPGSNTPPRLYVFRTSVQDATLTIAPASRKAAGESQRLRDELIVTLKAGEDIDALARKLGAKVIGRNDALHTYRLKFEDLEATDLARDNLRDNAAVESVDSNFSIGRPERPEMLTYGSSALPSLMPKAVTDGKTVVVGLIDSAVQAKGGNVSPFMLPGIAVAGASDPGHTEPSHGTSMAETILRGLAMTLDGAGSSAVRILPVDVYGNRSTTTTYDVANGVYQAINAGANTINLSLGSDGYSVYLHNVIKSGYDQGVIFFAAAGNSPVTSATYPAAFPEVVAVTAGDKRGNVANYANRGTFVDVVAPGSSIVQFNNQQVHGDWHLCGRGLCQWDGCRPGGDLETSAQGTRGSHSPRPGVQAVKVLQLAAGSLRINLSPCPF